MLKENVPIQPMVDYDSKDPTSQVGQRIKYAILHSGKNQKEIAGELDLTPQAINKWIRTGEISRKNLYKLGQATDFSADWIATGKKPKKNDNIVSEYHTVIKEYEPVFELNKLEITLIEQYRKTSSRDQRLIKELVKSLHNRNHST